jgi:uncharacterized protein DUF6894
MVRYYFTLFDGELVDDRPDGMDLPSFKVARQHAIAVANDLARNKTIAELDGSAVGVLDSDGLKLLDIPLTDIPED